MNTEQFELLFENQVQKCRDVLVNKAKEYASDGDRMHNFKIAARFNGRTPEQELWSFLTKHLVSLTDMVQSGDYYPPEAWDEKLGDALNYLFLLRALLVESDPVEMQMELFAVLADAASSNQHKTGDIHITQNFHGDVDPGKIDIPRDASLTITPQTLT